MNLEHAAIRLVQPREEDELVPRADALERVRHGRLQDDPGVGCPLVSLPWRVSPIAERRPDDADRVQTRRLAHRYCTIRIWLPDGSRKPASMPYGCSVGSCWNSTPRSLSPSYV